MMRLTISVNLVIIVVENVRAIKKIIALNVGITNIYITMSVILFVLVVLLDQKAFVYNAILVVKPVMGLKILIVLHVFFHIYMIKNVYIHVPKDIL